MLEFAGRIDQQLKIRGYRVEPGEIETRDRPSARRSTTSSSSRDRRAVGTLELIAYVRRLTTIAPATLRAALADSLPDYMVPAHWVQLERLPLNASHKVDRAALPPPGIASS